MQVNLINITPDPILKIASAAAITRGVSYAEVEKWDIERQKKLIMDCYDKRHWSVFEFVDIDIEVIGASRVFETQAVRSRLASFEWESGRRNQEYEVCDLYKQIPLEDYSVRTGIEDGITIYNKLVKNKKHAQDARYALPQGVARSGRIKRNFRNLMETAMVRMCSRAQYEYGDFMFRVKYTLSDAGYSFLSDLLKSQCQVLGYCAQGNPCLPFMLSQDEAKELLIEHGRRTIWKEMPENESRKTI